MSINKKYDNLSLNDLKALHMKAIFGPAINKHDYYAIEDAYERRKPIEFWYWTEPQQEDEIDEPWDGLLERCQCPMAMKGGRKIEVHYSVEPSYSPWYQTRWDDASKKLVLVKRWPF